MKINQTKEFERMSLSHERTIQYLSERIQVHRVVLNNLLRSYPEKKEDISFLRKKITAMRDFRLFLIQKSKENLH